MTFPSYPVYKDSGVEWQGAVPAEWPRSALKYLADYQNGYPFKPEDWGEEGLPIIRISQLTGDTAPNYYSGELDCRVKVGAGDLLFSWSATIDSFIWMGGAAWLNQHIFKVSPTVEADQKFLFYLIKLVAPKLADFDAHGSTMRHIKKESLSERLYVPTLVEQTQIARFLDHETARIDALIEEQQRLIELLKEKRQAVISHAVTKGLDPTAPMKDSGVEWLGEVPAHWEVTQIKRRCDLITDGAHISPETENGVYCFISTRDVSDEGIDFEGCLRTSAGSYEYLVRTGCQPEVGDVLFSKDGTIGRTIVVGEGSPNFVVASSLIIIRPSRAELLPSYLDFLCQSWVVSQQVDGFVKGAGLPRLSIQNLTKVVGVFPPLEEQVLIADFLQMQSVTARQLTSEALRTMELLKERRSALISAAVTGKIDVRGWQPSDSTQVPESAVAEAH
ncbi:restriction endonuclease subunit S [Stutzerimonas chloritidismutans]|uniref:restriction endonuclease subunit S n=1 Tax=Stutzerimonas chloritidismutans TaxID=203192 RepID=UPI0038504FFA